MYPRILHICGPLWINGYGLMIAIGFLLFTYLTYTHQWRKKLLSGEDYLNVLFWGFLSAIVGGRLLFVLFSPPQSWGEVKEVFYPWVGGFSLFGSIIAVLLFVSIYLKKRNISILKFFDLVALYAPLLQSIARVGCLMAGCCYGAMASAGSWWSVTFTDPYSLAPRGVPLYPTQAYSIIASFAIFLVLQIVARSARKVVPGSIILSYLSLECIARFMVDFWRHDRGPVSEVFGLGIPFSSMQMIIGCLFLFAVGGLIVILRRRG